MESISQKRYDEWRGITDMDEALASELKQISGNDDAINDRFYRELEFGTGGLRGVLGAGTNRMNIYTVRRATQGLANYLKKSKQEKAVAIAYDSRINSRLFAEETARVLSANDIKAHIYPRLEPTPALSFAVRYLRCGVGVCITASHNPAKYNGYKVYNSDGCQITLDAAEKITGEINAVGYFDRIKLKGFDEGLKDGSINYISEACLDAFVEAVYAQRVSDGAGIPELKLVYTPLNGTGLECVQKLLGMIGVTDVTVVPEQEKPDGNFPTCTYPNPEIKEAMELGLKLCKEKKPDLLIGTDPDCDRCGIAVPDGKGGYALISGNELGVILLDYICRTRKRFGTMPERPVAVTTIVTTDMASAVAEKYGVELRRTLTGFKFIGEQIGLLEKAKEEGRYIFGFEESYGYLSGSHVRDKDAVNAVLLICEAAAFYMRQGKTLLDAVNELYLEFGFYQNSLRSYSFEGSGGMKKIKDIMAKLRKSSPKQFGGFRVESVTDYLWNGTGLPKADVLEFRIEQSMKIMVRPSGTEPKIKIYLTSRGRSLDESKEALKRLTKAADALTKG